MYDEIRFKYYGADITAVYVELKTGDEGEGEKWFGDSDGFEWDPAVGEWGEYTVSLQDFPDGASNPTISVWFDPEDAATNARAVYYLDDIEVLSSGAPALSSDATLSSITPPAGNLTPAFDAEVADYVVQLSVGTTEVPSLVATATDAGAGVGITDAADLSGTSTIEVTAEDGETQQVYNVTFKVLAALGTDATLSSLTPAAGSLTPAFDAGVMAYVINLPAGSTAVPSLTAVATDAKADVTVTDAADLSGTSTILVTAEDGTELT